MRLTASISTSFPDRPRAVGQGSSGDVVKVLQSPGGSEGDLEIRKLTTIHDDAK